MERSGVCEETFLQKIKHIMDFNNGKRVMWDCEHSKKVKTILSRTEAKADMSHYYYFKKYELLQIGSVSSIVLKRSSESDDLVYMVPVEGYFEKLLEAHNQTGHGGRDEMLYYMKQKWRIPRSACEIFISCCETCNRKKSTVRKGVVVKPILSRGFNARGQVDLIDFQSCPDGEYKWLMNYQDHATKFIHLLPLQSKHAANVAEELSKIFFTFGAPAILQSDNGREFAANVVRELVSLWPSCKMVHGRPRHSQTQESVERANADVENMLRAWMIDNKSNEWARGCYEVQWLKNTSKHRVINRTPYEAMFGPMKNGVASFNLPRDVIANLNTEEDLENALRLLSDSDQQQQHQDNPTVLSTQEKTQEHICIVCESGVSLEDAVTYQECDLETHINCGTLADQDTFFCSLCSRKKHIHDVQEDCHRRQKLPANKMVTFSTEKFPELAAGDCITLAVPTVDRAPLDFSRILGVVLDKQNEVYQIGTKAGIIKGWFSRPEIQKSGASMITLLDVRRDNFLTLREAAAAQSKGQGYKKCNCKVTKEQCSTKRCSCFKANMKCGSRCHNSNSCANKDC
ncbi:KRAB-A domain-containing protein 2-like [Neodiprion virginianus]|uniref:KRAB-A domain-containing protein 2-like n=1 Tax=Neodiprion virginianus TaxID=2961670 RepID=UPI001EE76817|nr:KRAB-A domain-containing protein 2-like [Neodiprion virginianus]